VAGGRGPGAAAAIVATVSYDFFLTKPYLSMNIDSADDVETAVILLVIGLIVGQLVTITRRSRRKAERGAEEIARLHRVAEQAAQGADVGDVIRSTEAELSGLLDLEACRYERTRSGPPLPPLERGGAVVGGTRRLVGEDFELPPEGVELPVLGRGKDFGRFVLTPIARTPASIEERIVAVAISDVLGAALAATLDADAGDPSS
jgi:hypothetical protein